MRTGAAAADIRSDVRGGNFFQEALVRSVDGRNCPSQVDAMRFLAEIMRSVASGEVGKFAYRVPLVQVPKTGDGGDGADPSTLVADNAPNAEQALIQADRLREMRDSILGVFDDDSVARDIVDGVIEEMTGDEIRQLLGIDKTSYDSQRRLIRRRLDKGFPKGLRP
jgi:hypothetical protein